MNLKLTSFFLYLQMRKLKELEHAISETFHHFQHHDQTDSSLSHKLINHHSNNNNYNKTPVSTTNMTNLTKTTCDDDPAAANDLAADAAAADDDHAHEIINDNRLEEVEAHMQLTTKKEGSITRSLSDLDSALSSAPQSLSPHPESYADSSVAWPKSKEDIGAKYDYASEENEILHQELKNSRDRMENLVNKEASLVKELHELREQNELLEFRIIELEEAHDKVSR